MQKQGGGESRYLGRWKQILGEGGSGCFGKAGSGGRGVKGAKARWEAVDSHRVGGDDSMGVVKFFSPFVSV